MKRISILIFFVALSSATIFFSTGCVNNKKDILFSGCDSTNVSYSKTIKPILQNNCYSCHSTANGATLGGGIVLENHTNLIIWVDTAKGSDGGILVNDIKHTGNPMPKSASKLSNCDIAKISYWVNEGAKDN